MASSLSLFLLLSFSLAPPKSLAFSSDALLLLQKIKPALHGPTTSSQNIQLSSWNSSSLLCLWRGLSWSYANGSTLRCDVPSVRSNALLFFDRSLQLTSLHLPAAALSGYLPLELGEFSSLRSVNLAVNSLSGPFPLELANSPSLSSLDLSNNILNASLPPSLWNLCDSDRLASLLLHGNDFSGLVPPPATRNFSCENLAVLDFGSNRLAGNFPAFFTAFHGLAELDLSSNRFSGMLPADSVSGLSNLQRLNLSFNNFSGRLPESLRNRFSPDSFEGNAANFCSNYAPAPDSGGMSAGAKAGVVLGSIVGAAILASATIGCVQGRKKRRRKRRSKGVVVEKDMEVEEDVNDDDGNGDQLEIFEGGEGLTLEDVLNATGQVVERTSYETVYEAKLGDGGNNIAVRWLREGTCKDLASCSPLIRRIGRARHENLVPLIACYHGKRGEKFLIYDFLTRRTLHDLLHGIN